MNDPLITCRSCRHWTYWPENRPYNAGLPVGHCAHPKVGTEDEPTPQDGLGIAGEWPGASMVTGPDFGCIHHQITEGVIWQDPPAMTHRQALQEMLCELESSRLEVVLVPQRRRTNEGGMIRVCANKNAQWYSEFCRLYPSSRQRIHRKHDTRIRRARMIQILERMARGKATRSKYRFELVIIAGRRIERYRRQNELAELVDRIYPKLREA